jgi:hypothetical protein
MQKFRETNGLLVVPLYALRFLIDLNSKRT